ncbi:MAG: guanylate kinase [Proteobacteria bacterium]|jgi:guanylate kinase|nr:guanylate kinase [Desulfocapsa sp.]MBU3944541.1 guanylate kinase [Pseudomonadota bacterium]MCG2744128.1 guanylate kinase [Desulfobacteraceae bacterium]MBU3984510.1 guanylate kinase [Pseudomonadota bacterium]MBU4028130.1 guanylate kinase [Pseudomonadota bacterium]
MTTGKLFILSAPSGAGKTTLLKRVMADLPGLAFSVSHTTRLPRAGELDGVDYHFVSRDQFEAMGEQGTFLEWAEVHGNLYGTSRPALLAQLATGVDVILDIDVQGAEILRKSAAIPAASLFITPPSLQELERRLRGRGTDSEETILLRLKNARVEMQAVLDYEYLIVNDRLEQAIDTLRAVVIAERSRGHRLPTGQAIEILGEL